MVCDLFRLSAVSTDRLRDSLDGLQVDDERMRANADRLDAGAGGDGHAVGSSDAFIDRVLARMAASHESDQESP